MLTRFFSTAEVDAFAGVVVGELRRSLPVDDAARQTKAAARAREQTEANVRRRVDAFAACTRLNLYQKAKLGTRLEAALVAAGYPTGFSKAFAYDVVRTLALASAGKPA
jgi:hypothetical protein